MLSSSWTRWRGGHRSHIGIMVLFLSVSTLFGCGGGSGSSSPAGPVQPPPAPVVDWDLRISTYTTLAELTPALIGYYDLSGASLDYASVPGLMTAMGKVGFASSGGADWRIGLGRWEIATEIFDTLTDATPCLNFNAETQSAFATDLALIQSRDWFTFTDGSPVAADDLTDNRYALDYVRSVIDTAVTFGATPYLSIDLMPRALSINQAPLRASCDGSFTNNVSNNQPADPAVFAKAVAGLAQRVVEGTATKLGADRPRPVAYWEVWNEPETDIFWAPTLGADPDLFFNMALNTLQELDAYRRTTTDIDGQAIKIGLASFISSATAASTIAALDGSGTPLDFISFHAYDDDPLVIVDSIVQTKDAIQNSTDYQNIETVLAEWGPNLGTRSGDQVYADSIDPALHAATVIALGAAAGVDRSHNAIIYDFFAPLALGLIDNAGRPRPLYRAYELMSKLIGSQADRISVTGYDDGRLDSGMGAVLAARTTADGTIRVLLVNRQSTPRVVRVALDGATTAPTQLVLLDETTDPESDLTPIALPDVEFTLPARSMALAEF